MSRNYRKPSMSALRDIVSEKQVARFRFPSNGKSILVDLFTASAIVKVYDALSNQETKDKFDRMISGTSDQFMRVVTTCYKCLR